MNVEQFVVDGGTDARRTLQHRLGHGPSTAVAVGIALRIGYIYIRCAIRQLAGPEFGGGHGLLPPVNVGRDRNHSFHTDLGGAGHPMVALAGKRAVGHGRRYFAVVHSGHRDAHGIVDAGIEHVHHRGAHGGGGFEHSVARREIVVCDSAVAVGHLQVALVVESAGGRGGKLIESGTVGQLFVADEYERTLCGVHGCQHDIGRIGAAAHHRTAAGYDKGIEFVDAHVACVDGRIERGQSLALGVAYVVFKFCEQGHRRNHGF